MSPRDLTYQALATIEENPAAARELLQEAATLWVALGEPRLAAFCLHQRAGIALSAGDSPVRDLAAAAQLLVKQPEARAVVLLDLGHALRLEGDRRRARLVLKESAAAALAVGDQALHAEAHGLLRQVEAERMGVDLSRALRRHSPLLADQSIRDTMTLSPRAEQLSAAQNARAQAVEEELERIRRELRNGLVP